MTNLADLLTSDPPTSPMSTATEQQRAKLARTIDLAQQIYKEQRAINPKQADRIIRDTAQSCAKADINQQVDLWQQAVRQLKQLRGVRRDSNE
jgi:hypothetical protein